MYAERGIARSVYDFAYSKQSLNFLRDVNKTAYDKKWILGTLPILNQRKRL